MTNHIDIKNFGIKDHTIICNWTDKADKIIRELHNESVKDPKPIIIITEHPEMVPKTNASEYQALLIINGDPSDQNILERACLKDARSVIILAENNESFADTKSVLVALAIDSINPEVHVIVELNDSKNKIHFQYTKVNEIICLEQLAEKLLAQTALTPGLSQVYMDLLTQSSDTNEVYIQQIPKEFIENNISYLDLEKMILKNGLDYILIGFIVAPQNRIDKEDDSNLPIQLRKNKIVNPHVLVNPSFSDKEVYNRHYSLKEGDSVILIAYGAPELAKLTINK